MTFKISAQIDQKQFFSKESISKLFTNSKATTNYTLQNSPECLCTSFNQYYLPYSLEFTKTFVQILLLEAYKRKDRSLNAFRQPPD